MSIDTTKTITAVRYNGVPIPLAGGSSAGDGKKITFIDYDGTILKQEFVQPGAQVTVPAAPTHTDLTFTGWGCPTKTKTDIATDGYITAGDTNLVIGALYSSEATKFIVQAPKGQNLSFEASILFDSALNYNGITVDWGDGSAPSSVSSPSITHMMSIPGGSTITITLTSSADFGLLALDQGLRNYIIGAIVGDTCKSLYRYYGETTSAPFYKAYNLKYCLLSDVARLAINEAGTDRNAYSEHAFEGAISLSSIIIPNNQSMSYCFIDLVNLQYVALPTKFAPDNYGTYSILPSIFGHNYYAEETGIPCEMSAELYKSSTDITYFPLKTKTLDFTTGGITRISGGGLCGEGQFATTIKFNDNIYFGSKVNMIDNMGMTSYGYFAACLLMDFTACTELPHYSGPSDQTIFVTDTTPSSYMPTFNPALKVVVPDSLYSSFTDTTMHPEWSTLVPFMIRESEYNA